MVRVLGIYVWFGCMAFLVSGIEMLFGLVPFKTSPLFALVFVVLSFFSFVMGMFAGDVFLSVFLSLRRWGNPNPFWGLGFPPLVTLHPGRGLRARPVRLHFSPSPRPRPAPAVFFLFVSVVRLPGLDVLGLFWMGCVSLCGCLSGGGLLQAHRDCINAAVGWGRRTRHPSPF